MTPTNPATDERDLLAALARAVGEGVVTVELDCKRLLHTDSPIAVQADHTRWLYAIGLAVLAVGFLWDWTRGLVALVIGVVFYAGVGQPWIYKRMRARFFTKTLFDIAAFKRLWRLSGVGLNMVGADGQPVSCASPDGDWRRFVLDRLTPDRRAAPTP